MKSKLYILLSLFSWVNLTGQNFEGLEFGSDKTLDIISWNIEWFPKNGQVTADNIVEIVNALDADIIGLQEIGDIALFDRTIDRLPDYEWFFNQNWHDGLAYLYNTEKIEIKDSYVIYDTNAFWDIFPRSPLVAEIIYQGQEFVVINNHLKCCGDGFLDLNNEDDEETRRHEALLLLEEYIRDNLVDKNVILLGDLNDILTDDRRNNVFNIFLDNTEEYKFADLEIAGGSSTDWSYPSWPSHIDHILINKNLFDEFSDSDSGIETIKLDGYYNGGFSEYNFKVSDHRPVGLKLGSIVSSSVTQTKLNLNIFPNPTSSFITVESNENLNYVIKNTSGVTMLTGVIDSSIDLRTLPDGIYFIILENGVGKTQQSKISLVR